MKSLSNTAASFRGTWYFKRPNVGIQYQRPIAFFLSKTDKPFMSNISKWFKWGYYSQGNGQHYIRRYRLVNDKKKWETYPRDKYKDMNREEIEALLRRLNASREAEEKLARERYNYDNAYVNKRTLGDFETHLKNKSKNHEHINQQLFALNEYVLHFFINVQKVPDPGQWKKLEARYGDYLQSLPLCGSYVLRIIQTANRFLRFLHDQMPDEVKLIKLDPVARDILDSRDKESPNRKRKKFITPTDFDKICEAVDPRILPLVKLGYKFGLRRAECLGLSIDDIFEDSLRVERQLVRLYPKPQTKDLKDKDARDVPYWYCDPREAYDLIAGLTLVHPDTVSDLFSEACETLKLPYQFHDLRRTFITRSLRSYAFLDVRLAVGHEDLETLQGYIQDDREISRKKYVPK